MGKPERYIMPDSEREEHKEKLRERRRIFFSSEETAKRDARVLRNDAIRKINLTLDHTVWNIQFTE